MFICMCSVYGVLKTLVIVVGRKNTLFADKIMHMGYNIVMSYVLYIFDV